MTRAADGVIVAHGGSFGGWSLYVYQGEPAFCYSLFGLRLFRIYGDGAISSGAHQIRLEFAYDGGGLNKGGPETLYLDGAKVDEGRIDATVPMVVSDDEATDLGDDTGTPVTDDFGTVGRPFTGRIQWVELDTDEAAEDFDHLITPEERLQVAMARR